MRRMKRSAKKRMPECTLTVTEFATAVVKRDGVYSRRLIIYSAGRQIRSVAVVLHELLT